MTWWYHSKDKQCRPLPGGPYLPARYADPTCPGGTDPVPAAVTWSEVLDKPTEFPPEPHQHAWTDLVDLPDCFPPCEHGHGIDEIGGGSVDPLREPDGDPLSDPSGALLFPPGVSLQEVLDSKVSDTRRIDTTRSLQGGGNLQADRVLSLVGDVDSPGAHSTYATGPTGDRAWIPRALPLYSHNQGAPALVWTLNHNLACEPPVRTVNSSGVEIFGDVTYPTLNQAVVTFGTPTAGKAYVH